MERANYESPEFEFQELKLMERVADRCWGTNDTWYDVNQDGDFDDKGVDIYLNLKENLGLDNNGCNGKNAANALNKYARETYQIELNSTPDDCNTKNKRYSIAAS